MMTSRSPRVVTKKIQCQPKLSVISPPIAGPISELSPKMAPKKPWYLPRSDGAKMSPMMASATGKSAPAPRPWTPRKTRNCHISWLNAQRSDPIRKMPTPIMKIGRRPKMSDSFP